jgi:DNA-binding response OmpR family regulator
VVGDVVRKPSAQPTILIIEDELDLLEALRIKLSREGYQALAVPDGPQALAALASEEVDLIILDAIIPPPDGYKICQILKADHSYRHIPIVMLSARGMDSDVAKGYAAGADYYITKPIKPAALVRKVRDILGERGAFNSNRRPLPESGR